MREKYCYKGTTDPKKPRVIICAWRLWDPCITKNNALLFNWGLTVRSGQRVKKPIYFLRSSFGFMNMTLPTVKLHPRNGVKNLLALIFVRRSDYTIWYKLLNFVFTQIIQILTLMIVLFKGSRSHWLTWKLPLSSFQLSLASGPPTRAPCRTWPLRILSCIIHVGS